MPRVSSARGSLELRLEWRIPAADDRIPRQRFDINALLHPGTIFDHPKDVLTRPNRSIQRNEPFLLLGRPMRRQTCPALRAPSALKAPVSIDEILEALCELDGGPRNPPGGKPIRLRSTARTLAA